MQLIAAPLLPIPTGAAQLTTLDRAGPAWQLEGLEVLEVQWPACLGLQQGHTAGFDGFALCVHIL